MKRFLKPWRLILYVIGIRLLISTFSTPTFELPSEVAVSEWDTYTVFTDDLWRLDRMRTQRALWLSESLQPLQVWAYQFSGSYTPTTLIEALNNWPQYEYSSVTLLEWWSSYDMDDYLTQQWLTESGEYRDFVTDRWVIDRNAEVYEFLAQALQDRSELISLEWYLYPDTYRVDTSQPIVSQLVRSQLQTFDTRVWQPYGEQLTSLSNTLKNEWRDFGLSSYAALILATVVLKEEQYVANMTNIAWVFMNRLDLWMRLDADITLCYGLNKGYENCTPTTIVNNLYDTKNLYNTRQLGGLTPTPIASVTADSVNAILEAIDHDNLFYLHDPQWGLHMAKTNAQHNSNKSKYLR